MIEKADVTVEISTKNRYYTTLPLAILSVINQTVKPKRLILLDDGEHKDLRGEPIYRNIFMTLDFHDIKWEVVFGDRTGQVANHEKARLMTYTKFIWRLDDDNFAEANVLEKLYNTINNDTKIGAVASLVLHPGSIQKFDNSEFYVNKIQDISDTVNAQWGTHDGKIKQADHLYSTFLYRKEAAIHGYCKELSPAGHREETIFTYEMKKRNWELLICTDVITWHYRYATGGIRENAQEKYWNDDETIFRKKMAIWGVQEGKIIVLDNGLGDHYAFKHIINEIKAKYPKLTLAVCFPDVFKDDNVRTISIGEAKLLLGENLDSHGIYSWMDYNFWRGSMIDAYRRCYL